MREIMELMHRTHIGVDQHYENITKQSSRTALADGWGGSMVATEISDILFGTPTPVAVDVNMGVLKEDHVNVIIHGHEPNMFESMLVSVNEPTLVQAAKDAGAQGINLVGMCCSGAEMMSRHGVPHAGNFMSTEADSGDRCRRCHVCGHPMHQARSGECGRLLSNAADYHQHPCPHRRCHPY
jgi:carbon-monoxide dehydrogenase catalytic subunit